MKFIFSFFVCLTFLTPVYADFTPASLCEQQVLTNCNSTAGCEWSAGACSTCQSGTYNDGNQNGCVACPNGYDNGWTQLYKAHDAGENLATCTNFICTGNRVKSNDGQSCILNCSGITEPKFLPDGETNCDNWQCRAGYYRGGTNNDECKTCPNNSDNCTTNGGNYGLTTATVTCESGYIKSVSNGVVTCSTCPEHAEQSGNTCVCTTGYYGDGDTCTACPAGTTTGTAGATAKSACHMTQNTKFCDANGENCMKLLSGQNQNSINQ